MTDLITSSLSDNSSLPFYVLAVLVVVLALWIILLERKISRLLSGKNAKTLEDTINNATKDIAAQKVFQRECIEYLKQLDGRLRTSLRGSETIRFNPFKGTGAGGNQSFASAFVNEKGDGVVISSLYAHDRTSVFSKPLKKFGSEFQLSEEEKAAITAAKESLKISRPKN